MVSIGPPAAASGSGFGFDLDHVPRRAGTYTSRAYSATETLQPTEDFDSGVHARLTKTMAWLRRDKDCIALVVAWELLLQAAILSFASGVHAATQPRAVQQGPIEGRYNGSHNHASPPD